MQTEARFVQVTELGKVTLEVGAKPDVQPNDALARVLYAGVCGTDVHLVHSKQPFPWKSREYPFRLGHEWVGRLEQIGSGFPEHDAHGNPLSEQDRIVAMPSTWACGKCFACRVLLSPNLCTRPGLERSLPPDMSAFADWFYLPEGTMVFKVPDRLESEVAVLTEPTAVALRALERAYLPGAPDRYQGLGPGKSVAVLGSGPVGTLITVLARKAGCFPIFVVGGPLERLDLCEKLGASMTMDISSTSSNERAEAIIPETLNRFGVDVVFEAAGSPSAFAEAIGLTRPGGTLVEVGHYTDHGTVAVNPLDICRKDIHLFGCWGYGPQQFGEALRILADDSETLARVITHRFPLERAQEALEVAQKQEAMKAVLEIEE